VLGVSAGLKHFGKRRLGRSGLADDAPLPGNVWVYVACGLVVGAPMDLQRWFKGYRGSTDEARFAQATEAWFFGTDTDTLRKLSPLFHPHPIGRPVMPLSDGDLDEPLGWKMEAMRRKMKQAGDEPVFTEATRMLGGATPEGKARLYAVFQTFLANRLTPKSESSSIETR
jgi:hypothetical protein